MSDGGFHPDLRALAAVLPRGTVGPRTYKWMRRSTARLARPAAGVETITLGPISLRVHGLGADEHATPALLWMHGGGYVMGTAAQDDAVCRFLAEGLRIVVAAVDYRLAPEHPFPTPLHDCHDALEWLAAHPAVDAARIAIGGASAGGGLAAALALLARRRRSVEPVFQLLSYPMLEDRTVLRDEVTRGLRLWNPKCNRFGWSAYVGEPGGRDVPELAAVARAGDLSGLPPAWIGVGSLDLFYGEDLAYAAALGAAGVPCETLVVDGAFHGFDSVAPRAGITRAFREAQAAALRSAFATSSSEERR